MRPLLCLFGIALVPAAGVAADEPVKLVGKVGAVAPADWTVEKPANRLRSAQFKLAGPDGSPAAELYVMPESSPDADKYFPRWKGSFVEPEGKTLDDISKATKFEAGPATVHLLDVTGTWKYKERPFDPKSKEELKDNYRVVWAVVVVKDEAAHVRLSGPAETVGKNYAAFEKWLRSIK